MKRSEGSTLYLILNIGLLLFAIYFFVSSAKIYFLEPDPSRQIEVKVSHDMESPTYFFFLSYDGEDYELIQESLIYEDVYAKNFSFVDELETPYEFIVATMDDQKVFYASEKSIGYTRSITFKKEASHGQE